MGCDSEVLTNLIASLGCEKPAYCPPCVATLEDALTALIDANTARLDNILSGSATLDFGSIAAGAVAELTITVTGAVAGSPVSLSPPSGIEASLVWSGYVSAADTVTVRLYNPTGGAVDPASGEWKASVILIA